jgi:branched-subunit amino acid ABC-type transport system permease component
MPGPARHGRVRGFSACSTIRFVQAFLSLFLRLALVAIGLVAAAAFAVVFSVLLAAWLLRSAWGRLTGRPVAPFGMRFGTHRAFEEMMRRAKAGAGTRTPRADAAVGRRARLADVTDVEPK